MYISKQFHITDRDEIFSFIEHNAFGQIISTLRGRLFSSHIPFLVSDDRQKLFGHFARQNPQASDINGQEVMVTLEGPHGYISPTWYLNPGVPTWNYQAVHIYGTCKILPELAAVKTIVDSLSTKYEDAFETYWNQDYNPGMLKHIVGFEIEIKYIQCKYKLSQNRAEHDRESVISHLQSTGSKALADAVRAASEQ
ncbi:FMN-binding negative transcriptional regulator [Porticoccaceae bacterium]|nr:FMN-binding negative transcriptional regulator [Porticoccaceae bacterium]MDC0011053.1 FMN-binding negative transcriptional regulator [Porticoccaceae bacterium]MDC1453116.1 FMN-binding negative transcriptional regulator [Porticoccaceae bacterium]